MSDHRRTADKARLESRALEDGTPDALRAATMAVVSTAWIDRVARGEYVPTADQRLVMYGVTWDAFESFLSMRGDRLPRVAYLEGTLELMSPSRDHERLKTYFAAVVE